MLAYVTIGALDSEVSGKFYDAVFGATGCERKFADGGWIGYGPLESEQPSVFVCPPYDGKPAHSGNGMMVGLKAGSNDAVDAAHRAGLANGGTDEGAPGYRPPGKVGWYGAYMRDPTGNKICVFHAG